MPQWKVWLATNDAPTTRADDDAWWDRAKPIPFNVKFRRTEGEIKNYAEISLKEEVAFQPASRGCCCVVAGRAEPSRGRGAGSGRRRDRDDWLQRFIDEHLEQTSDPEQYAIRSKVFERFTEWADTNKEARSVNNKNFMEAIRRKGFKDESVKQKGKTQRVWVGWRLKTSVEQGVGATVRADTFNTEELGI